MHEDLANSVNHQTWEILRVKLGNSSIKRGGECRFKHGEFEILTPNIGKIVKPESKMRRMEIYSKNHNKLNTIYAIMCMGRAGTTDFFPAVMQNLAIRSNRNPLDRLANGRLVDLPLARRSRGLRLLPVRTPQMGFQDRCMQGQRCPLLATSART